MSNQQKNEQKKNLTASQRLDALENGLAMVDGTIGELYNTLDRTTRAITLLSKKLEAVKRASGLTDDQVAKILQEIDIAELKARVDDMVSKGALRPAETLAGDMSFVVARELKRDTKDILEQRIQFPMFNQPEMLKTALNGKKVGDIVDYGEKYNLVEILEIYEVALPESSKKEEDASTADAEAAAANEAAATEQAV